METKKNTKVNLKHNVDFYIILWSNNNQVLLHSPSCWVGFIFSLSSPLICTITIGVVQLDKPGSKHVTKRHADETFKYSHVYTLCQVSTHYSSCTWSDAHHFPFVTRFLLQFSQSSSFNSLVVIYQTWNINAQRMFNKYSTLHHIYNLFLTNFRVPIKKKLSVLFKHITLSHKVWCIL